MKIYKQFAGGRYPRRALRRWAAESGHRFQNADLDRAAVGGDAFVVWLYGAS